MKTTLKFLMSALLVAIMLSGCIWREEGGRGGGRGGEHEHGGEYERGGHYEERR